MSMRNSEGYYDPTAEAAIAKIMKEQRRKNRNRNKKVFTKPKIRPGSQIWKAKHKRRIYDNTPI